MWAVLEAGHLGQSWLDWVGSSWDECTSPAYGSRLVEQQATNSHLFAGAPPLQDWWGMECMKNLDRLVWSVGRKWIGIDYNNGEDTAGRGMRACQTRIIRSNPPSQPPLQVKVEPCKIEEEKTSQWEEYRSTPPGYVKLAHHSHYWATTFHSFHHHYSNKFNSIWSPTASPVQRSHI